MTTVASLILAPDVLKCLNISQAPDENFKIDILSCYTIDMYKTNHFDVIPLGVVLSGKFAFHHVILAKQKSHDTKHVNNIEYLQQNWGKLHMFAAGPVEGFTSLLALTPERKYIVCQCTSIQDLDILLGVNTAGDNIKFIGFKNDESKCVNTLENTLENVFSCDIESSPEKLESVTVEEAAKDKILERIAGLSERSAKRKRNQLADVQYGNKGILRSRAAHDAAQAWLEKECGDFLKIKIEKQGESSKQMRRYLLYNSEKDKWITIRTLSECLSSVKLITGRDFWDDMFLQPEVYKLSFSNEHFKTITNNNAQNEEAKDLDDTWFEKKVKNEKNEDEEKAEKAENEEYEENKVERE